METRRKLFQNFMLKSKVERIVDRLQCFGFILLRKNYHQSVLSSLHANLFNLSIQSFRQNLSLPGAKLLTPSSQRYGEFRVNDKKIDLHMSMKPKPVNNDCVMITLIELYFIKILPMWCGIKIFPKSKYMHDVKRVEFSGVIVWCYVYVSPIEIPLCPANFV